MSELTNPLFDERELLERQKEEYKKALMGDVDQIKNQGQEIGKKVAIAGGVVLAGLLLRRLFGGGSKKKDKKVKKGEKELRISHTTYPPASTPMQDYDSMVHEQEDAYTLSSERMHHAHHPEQSKARTGVSKSFMSSELAQMITHQLAALLMVYITKKVEEYLSSVKNHDIAARPIEVTEVQSTEYIIPEEDAI